MPRSPKIKANCTVEDIAGGSSRPVLISSAITVNKIGTPGCEMAVISSSGLARIISPVNRKNFRQVFII